MFLNRIATYVWRYGSTVDPPEFQYVAALFPALSTMSLSMALLPA